MMNSFKYLGFTFVPFGNIIGKTEELKFQRLMWRTDTLSPLLNKDSGYSYEDFYKIASKNCADTLLNKRNIIMCRQAEGSAG